jgi:hypothetical protein
MTNPVKKKYPYIYTYPDKTHTLNPPRGSDRTVTLASTWQII